MNANEVIANRALELLGRAKGDYAALPPQQPRQPLPVDQRRLPDRPPHRAHLQLAEARRASCEQLIASFRAKGEEFAGVIKMGRTQLQDAVPMTLGQEFEAYAVTLGEDIERLEENAAPLPGGQPRRDGHRDRHQRRPGYAELAVARAARDHRPRRWSSPPNLVEATQDTGAFVMFSSAVKRLAVKLSKICNDLRLLSSGPRAGLHEINLPTMQPGSSIMPGKVNPVIPEVVNQVAFKVIGNDLAVTLAAEAGQLQLNVFEPVIAQSLFESIEMLKNGDGHAPAPVRRRHHGQRRTAAGRWSSGASAS